MKTILNKPELVSLLQQQLKDINTLCNEYDNGNETVVALIAEKITGIFHNTDHSKALLGQLKLSHLNIYCSSEVYNPKSLTNFIGLLKLAHRTGKGWGYAAKLDLSTLTSVSQENWWNNKKVIIDSDGNAFTRAKIVKSIANVDPLILNISGWKIKDAQGNSTIVNPIPETIRQIAFELLESFRDVELSKESKLHYKV
ncbi:hypothetical protein J7E50_01125 [Pedobacter sp. ISL-68]|uniref:hypothetical protein n=1 Tax=unclassified Pedobacter TaxID=2628915 RepID=UPI001BE4E6BE|nr:MULTISPECIES: hypothetical protein [unclassified Pedobacter]MBT2564590.1 hypothetical protein [Pedobacter sp. ISL-64]MBT2588802.1 hypothetical protein [Pedobacter sp. ISL-68]